MKLGNILAKILGQINIQYALFFLIIYDFFDTNKRVIHFFLEKSAVFKWLRTYTNASIKLSTSKTKTAGITQD